MSVMFVSYYSLEVNKDRITSMIVTMVTVQMKFHIDNISIVAPLTA